MGTLSLFAHLDVCPRNAKMFVVCIIFSQCLLPACDWRSMFIRNYKDIPISWWKTFCNRIICFIVLYQKEMFKNHFKISHLVNILKRKNEPRKPSCKLKNSKYIYLYYLHLYDKWLNYNVSIPNWKMLHLPL